MHNLVSRRKTVFVRIGGLTLSNGILQFDGKLVYEELVKAWSGKNPFPSKITLHQDRGVSQEGYVNLLPFVRGGDGYLRRVFWWLPTKAGANRHRWAGAYSRPSKNVSY
jgi:hypothetical protein